MNSILEKLTKRLNQLASTPAFATDSGMIMGACTSGCAASCSGCSGCGSGCSSIAPCPRR